MLPESDLFGERRARRSVIRGHHGIVARQFPLLAILLGRHAERAQMPPERFEPEAVVQAYEIIGRDRFADAHRRRLRLRRRLGRSRPGRAVGNRHQALMHGLDEGGKLAQRQRIIRHESGDDVAG